MQIQAVGTLHRRPVRSDYLAGPTCGDCFRGWHFSDISLRSNSPAQSGINVDAMRPQHIGMRTAASTDFPLHHLLQENTSQQFHGHCAMPSQGTRPVAFAASASGWPFYDDHPSAFPLTRGVDRQWSCSNVQNSELRHAPLMPAVIAAQGRGAGDALGQLARQALQDNPQRTASLPMPTFHSRGTSHHYVQQSAELSEELQYVKSEVCPDRYLAPWGTEGGAHLLPWPQQQASRGVQQHLSHSTRLRCCSVLPITAL